MEGTVMAKAMAPDPAIGVWTLNLFQSSFRQVPTPTVLKIESWEDGLKVTADMPGALGHKRQPAIIYRFDGKEYPLTGSTIADTISAKRINELITDSVWKKDGRVVFTMRIGVSMDGKTLNVMRTSICADGPPIDEIMVYDKE
jgi:hypothetical protein